MGDIKLFRYSGDMVSELPGHVAQVEKALQNLFEAHLEPLLGVRFLASEYYTGAVHNGRIDTLGIDEDDSPVIIEFKRSMNENVMAQGLYYLDWLVDHKKEFEWLVLDKFGAEVAKKVDWSEPRVICIAGDFTRYDEHAAKQMPGNIELLRYRRFGSELLLLEIVHAPNISWAISTTKAKAIAGTNMSGNATKTDLSDAPVSTKVETEDPYIYQRISYRISQSTGHLRELFEATWQFLASLGDDVQVAERRQYIAFKRFKNFACLEVYPQPKVVIVFLKVDPASITLAEGFTRDVTNVGHYGTGNLQVSMHTLDDLERAKPLLVRSYECS